MTWGVLALVALATYRVSRLVTTDEITEPLREYLVERYPPREVAPNRLVASWPVTFVHCSWCVSIWTSLALLVATFYLGLVPTWQLLAIAWPAVAAVAGLIYEIAE